MSQSTSSLGIQNKIKIKKKANDQSRAQTSDRFSYETNCRIANKSDESQTEQKLDNSKNSLSETLNSIGKPYLRTNFTLIDSDSGEPFSDSKSKVDKFDSVNCLDSCLELNNNDIFACSLSPVTIEASAVTHPEQPATASSEPNSFRMADHHRERNQKSSFAKNRRPMESQKNSVSPSTATTVTPASVSSNTIESPANEQLRDKSSPDQDLANISATTNLGVNQIPTYSSIFMQHQLASNSAARRPNSPAKNITSRAPLRKQYAQTDIDEVVNSPNAKLNSASRQTFSYRSLSKDDDPNYDDEDDEIDDQTEAYDEKLPFSSKSHHKLGSTLRRQSPDSPLPVKQSNLCDYDHSQARYNNPNTKISFGPSNDTNIHSNACKANFCPVDIPYANRKIDSHLIATPGCVKCNCNNCYKKRKLIKNGDYQLISPTQVANFACPVTSKRTSKTKTFHLILKSIVLILLTLILLMILVGALMASHFLPIAINNALNASRSFNVTIAGR